MKNPNAVDLLIDDFQFGLQNYMSARRIVVNIWINRLGDIRQLATQMGNNHEF